MQQLLLYTSLMAPDAVEADAWPRPVVGGEVGEEEVGNACCELSRTEAPDRYLFLLLCSLACSLLLLSWSALQNHCEATYSDHFQDA